MAAFSALQCITILGKTAVYYLTSRRKIAVNNYLQDYAILQIIFATGHKFIAPNVAITMFFQCVLPFWLISFRSKCTFDTNIDIYLFSTDFSLYSGNTPVYYSSDDWNLRKL